MRLVELPAGTTVAKADRSCKETGSGGYNCVARKYCFVNENPTDAFAFAFTLRVDETVSRAGAAAASLAAGAGAVVLVRRRTARR
ncbi:hypothetical protein [Streptomyces sp. NPDC058751]|uniref:hypothetical protein n=1 Tax=Streptomyces sp. NPDC058751 TaxID=3346623 RepID=UPI003686A7AB